MPLNIGTIRFISTNELHFIVPTKRILESHLFIYKNLSDCAGTLLERHHSRHPLGPGSTTLVALIQYCRQVAGVP